MEPKSGPLQAIFRMPFFEPRAVSIGSMFRSRGNAP
jgi:hypothetical protein